MTLSVTHSYVSSVSETTPSGGPGATGLVGPTEWNANHTLTGVASPAQGGTGITSGTGVTFFSSANVIADSGTLTANALMVGGGANGSPATLASLGTTSQLLHGNASGNPSFGAVNLGSEVAGTLSTANLTAATTAAFGIVKPDNSTVTISSGVLSSVGGSGSPGGATGNVQFASSGSTFSGDGQFTYGGAGTGVTIKLSSSTSTAGISALSIVTSSSSSMASNASALNIAATWNNSGTVYDAPLLLNVTNTASASGSKIADFQVGGSAVASIDPNGTLYFNASSTVQPPSAGVGNWVGNIALFQNAGGLFFNIGSGLMNITSAGRVAWNSDAGISRATAKVLQLGDSGGNAVGWLNWAGQARVTSGITSTSTTVANATGLSFTPQASRNYSFVAELLVTCASSGGIQLTVNATSTTTTYTLNFDGYLVDNTVRGYAQGTAFGNIVASSLTTGTAAHVRLTGTLETSGTAPSTFVVQFAQNTLSATQTKILEGSYMTIHDMP